MKVSQDLLVVSDGPAQVCVTNVGGVFGGFLFVRSP
jgi:hypothetical protein